MPSIGQACSTIPININPQWKVEFKTIPAICCLINSWYWQGYFLSTGFSSNSISEISESKMQWPHNYLVEEAGVFHVANQINHKFNWKCTSSLASDAMSAILSSWQSEMTAFGNLLIVVKYQNIGGLLNAKRMTSLTDHTSRKSVGIQPTKMQLEYTFSASGWGLHYLVK